MDKSLRPYVWMLLGSFSFACMGTMTHQVGEYLDWQLVAIVRSAIPLIIILLVALASGVKLVFVRPRVLWMRSIAGSISLVGSFYALNRLPVSDVMTVVNIFPIWIALLSWPLLGTVPSGQVWLSVVCGMAGVFLIQQPHFIEGNFAVLVTLAVSLFTALAMIGLHRLQGIDILAVIVHFSTVSLCFSVAAYFAFERNKTTYAVPPEVLLELAGVGLTATVGQLFLTKAFTHGDPSKVSVVGLSQIVFALSLDAFVLDHPPDLAKLLGVPLVIAPTAWLILRHHIPRGPAEPLDTPAPE